MEKIMTSLKQSRIWRLLSVLVVGLLLVVTTACSNGDVRGARPNNPSVQMGGNNNPHSMGGDGYTNYKASTDPKVNRTGNERSDASLQQPLLRQYIASSVVEPDSSGILYPGSMSTEKNRSNVKSSGDNNPANQIPVPRQEVIDRSDPDENIMENIGKQFREASDFLKEDVDTSVEKGILNEKAKSQGSARNDTIFDKSH